MTARYHTKVIRVRAEDSPNVQLGLQEVALGLAPSHRVLVPGVLTYEEYLTRRKTWDAIRQMIGLDGLFYKGAQVLLFPPDWLDVSERIANGLSGRKREAKGIGVDPAEGGDSTCAAVVDEFGLIELNSWKTPDTSVIRGNIAALAKRYGVPDNRICFDRGGGGKQIADEMRAIGMKGVRTISFGEEPSLEIRRGLHQISDRREVQEAKGAYLNRRAQMYYELRLLIDPNQESKGWGISSKEVELRRQLSPMPLLYTPEGKVKMLPKDDPSGKGRPTLKKLIGCSPDEADAVVLAVHAMLHKGTKVKAGAV